LLSNGPSFIEEEPDRYPTFLKLSHIIDKGLDVLEQILIDMDMVMSMREYWLLGLVFDPPTSHSEFSSNSEKRPPLTREFHPERDSSVDFLIRAAGH
jgi:hypothetical protein